MNITAFNYIICMDLTFLGLACIPVNDFGVELILKVLLRFLLEVGKIPYYFHVISSCEVHKLIAAFYNVVFSSCAALQFSSSSKLYSQNRILYLLKINKTLQ